MSKFFQHILISAALASLSSAGLAAQSQPIIIAQSHDVDISLSHNLDIFIDETQNLAASDILDSSIQNQFLSIKNDTIYYFNQRNFWLRFEIDNQTAIRQSLRLLHHYNITDALFFYKIEDGNLVLKGKRGDNIVTSGSDKNFRLPNIAIKAEPGRSTYYIMVKTLGPVNLDFSILDEETFVAFVRNDFLFIGSLFGIVLVMAAYNLLLAFRLKIVAYYFYSAYILGFVFIEAMMSGTLNYLVPQTSMTRFLSDQGLILGAEFTGILVSIFGLIFLDIRNQSPRLFKALLLYYPLAVADIFLIFFNYNLSISFVLVTNGYITCVLFASGIHGCFRRYRPAYFYTLAWSFLLVGNALYLYCLFGLLPRNALTTWGQFLGGAIEVVLLSLALGDRLRLMQEEAGIEIGLLNDKLQLNLSSIENIVDEKTRDIKSILYNIRQGIFLVSAKDQFIMPEFSRYLVDILGTNEIAGKSMATLIYAKSSADQDAINRSEAVLANVLGEDEVNFLANESNLIRELQYKGAKGERILALDWSPICNLHGRIERVLVSIRDVTELRELNLIKQQKANELKAIGSILKIPNDKFISFAKNCDDILESCHSILDGSTLLATADLNRLLVLMHTMKGMTRTYQFDDLTNVIHEMETNLEKSKGNYDLKAVVELKKNWMNVDESLKVYKNINYVILDRKESHNFINKLWIKEKVQQLKSFDFVNLPIGERKIVASILDEFEGCLGLNLEQTLEIFLNGLPSIANSLGKVAPKIIFENDNFSLNSEGQVLVERIFSHILVNAIDHGIESKEVRLAKGKAPRGIIRIVSEIEANFLVVSIIDDGQGLNLKKILETARAKGIVTGSQNPGMKALAEFIFLPSFTTTDSVSLNSGRGVGLDAVRRFLAADGSSIHIEFLHSLVKELQDEIVAFKFVLKLDCKLYFTNRCVDPLKESESTKSDIAKISA